MITDYSDNLFSLFGDHLYTLSPAEIASRNAILGERATPNKKQAWLLAHYIHSTRNTSNGIFNLDFSNLNLFEDFSFLSDSGIFLTNFFRNYQFVNCKFSHTNIATTFFNTTFINCDFSEVDMDYNYITRAKRDPFVPTLIACSGFASVSSFGREKCPAYSYQSNSGPRFITSLGRGNYLDICKLLELANIDDSSTYNALNYLFDLAQ